MSDKSGLFKFLNLENLLDRLIDYFEKRIELVKIQVMEEASDKAAKLATVLVLLTLGLISLLFISITLALFIADLVNSYFLGFLSISLIYLVLFWVAIVNREKLNSRFSKAKMEDLVDNGKNK